MCVYIYIYVCMYMYIYIYIHIKLCDVFLLLLPAEVPDTYTCVRPVPLLRVWVSKGLTQADS